MIISGVICVSGLTMRAYLAKRGGACIHLGPGSPASDEG